MGANRCGDTIDGWTNTGSKGDEGCDNLTPNNLFYKETDSFTLNKDTTIDNNEACFVNSLFVFFDKRDTDEWKEMKAILLPREYIYANRIGQSLIQPSSICGSGKTKTVNARFYDVLSDAIKTTCKEKFGSCMITTDSNPKEVYKRYLDNKCGCKRVFKRCNKEYTGSFRVAYDKRSNYNCRIMDVRSTPMQLEDVKGCGKLPIKPKAVRSGYDDFGGKITCENTCAERDEKPLTPWIKIKEANNQGNNR